MSTHRRRALLSSGLALALLPTTATAGEPLEAIDTPEGAIPMGPTPPPSLAGQTATDPPLYLGDKILFVNFDGGDMSFCGNNDPANNCSTIFNGTVLPFSGDTSRRASVIQTIRKRVADFGITVTDQRPASGDYDMEMVGNWEGQDPPFAGVAPHIDCFDAVGGETSFTLEASGSADGIAEIVLQEVAHTWGLEHVNEQQDLLFPTTQGTGKTFHDQCYKIVSDTQLTESNGQCNMVHTQFCSFGWQNSYQELLYLFGPSVPDTIAPAVSIVAPQDGAMIEGGDLELVISLQDDQSPAIITTNIVITSDALPEPVEADGVYAAPGELTFPINGLPAGTYAVQVDIQDESDNPASDEVSFTVLEEPPAGGESGGGTGSDDAADGESGAGDGGPGDGGTDAGGTDDAGLIDPSGPTSNGGCDCRSGGPRRGPSLALGLLVLAGLAGRRRRR